MNVLNAYDNLPHDLIVEKREAYGIDRKSLHLVSAYLNFRKQRIKIGSAYTDWVDVIRGIPRSSISGPLLFNVFINNLFVVSEKFNTCNFANGSIPIFYGNNLPLILSKLEHGMENLLY